MIAAGLCAHLTCIDPRSLASSFAGRTFDAQLLSDLPPEVDPCGERGEFHTFAFAEPNLLAYPICTSRRDRGTRQFHLCRLASRTRTKHQSSAPLAPSLPPVGSSLHQPRTDPWPDRAGRTLRSAPTCGGSTQSSMTSPPLRSTRRLSPPASTPCDPSTSTRSSSPRQSFRPPARTRQCPTSTTWTICCARPALTASASSSPSTRPALPPDLSGLARFWLNRGVSQVSTCVSPSGTTPEQTQAMADSGRKLAAASAGQRIHPLRPHPRASRSCSNRQTAAYPHLAEVRIIKPAVADQHARDQPRNVRRSHTPPHPHPGDHAAKPPYRPARTDISSGSRKRWPR